MTQPTRPFGRARSAQALPARQAASGARPSPAVPESPTHAAIVAAAREAFANDHEDSYGAAVRTLTRSPYRSFLWTTLALGLFLLVGFVGFGASTVTSVDGRRDIVMPGSIASVAEIGGLVIEVNDPSQWRDDPLRQKVTVRGVVHNLSDDERITALDLGVDVFACDEGATVDADAGCTKVAWGRVGLIPDVGPGESRPFERTEVGWYVPEVEGELAFRARIMNVSTRQE